MLDSQPRGLPTPFSKNVRKTHSLQKGLVRGVFSVPWRDGPTAPSEVTLTR